MVPPHQLKNRHKMEGDPLKTKKTDERKKKKRPSRGTATYQTDQTVH